MPGAYQIKRAAVECPMIDIWPVADTPYDALVFQGESGDPDATNRHTRFRCYLSSRKRVYGIAQCADGCTGDLYVFAWVLC